MTHDVDVVLSVDDIYTHSPLRVTAHGPGPFSMRMSKGYVFRIHEGRLRCDETIAAVGAENEFEVDFELAGVFAQLPATRDKSLRPGVAPGVSRAEYGVRFFPFISSVLALTIEIEGSVRSLAIDYRSGLRPNWDRLDLKDPDLQAHRQVLRAHSPSGWREVSRFHDQPRELHLTLPLCSSQRELFRAVLYPLAAWIGSLLAVFAARELVGPAAVVPVVAGTLALVLRESLVSARAHQLHLGQMLLLAEATLIATWATVVTFWCTGAVVIMAAALCCFAYVIVRFTTNFEYRGRLPRWLEGVWGTTAVALERGRARRRRRYSVSPFDHDDWE